MNKWNLTYRVAAIDCAIVVVTGIIAALINAPDGFAFQFGLVCLAGGVFNLLLSFFAYLAGSKEWAKGFLLGAGILLLLSGISCGTGFAYMN